MTARIGQAIQIRLQTIGPGYYGTPEISSSAVRFESETSPKEVIPAGPTQVYRFLAASEGEAQLKILHILRVAHSNGVVKDSTPTFAVTIRVYQRREP